MNHYDVTFENEVTNEVINKRVPSNNKYAAVEKAKLWFFREGQTMRNFKLKEVKWVKR